MALHIRFIAANIAVDCSIRDYQPDIVTVKFLWLCYFVAAVDKLIKSHLGHLLCHWSKSSGSLGHVGHYL